MEKQPIKSFYLSVRLLGLASVALAPSSAVAAYGLTTTTGHYTVDTGGGLVFKVDRLNGGIPSIVWDGTELNGSTASGLISGLSSEGTTVTATADTNMIVITAATDSTNQVVAGLTHYYIVQNGVNNIYMATHTTAHPGVGELRWITRLSSGNFTTFQTGSDLREETGAIESSDVFGFADGTTGSKYYGNQRAKDLTIRGISGPGRGVFMAYGNRETSSGGPFYQDIQNQTSEVYNYMNSGHNQTELPYRLGLHGPYALCFTSGATPVVPDMSFIAGLGLVGYVDAAGRGSVTCAGISNWDTSYAYTAGFANSTAQYWTDLSPVDGSFTKSGMKPGTYTMKIYKNEYAVYTSTTVDVTAGGTTTLNPIPLTSDASTRVPVWRIGNWDGTPLEFLNAANIRFMHPSDVRMSSWTSSTFVTGTSSVGNFPSIQWKAFNGNQSVEFDLTAPQVVSHTLRIGITGAYAGGRPTIMVNSWSSALPSASTQPNSRSVTLGSYRGNNTIYSFSVPSSAFVVGTNTLKISAISGSAGSDYLSPNYSLDCVDMFESTAPTLAVPISPSVLTATGGDTQVNLSWTAATDAASYIVKSATTAGGPYAIIASGVTGTTYTDTGLTNGATYYYVVQGINTSGTGLPSPEASATTVGEMTIPKAPADPAATAVSTSGIDLTWTTSLGASSYNLKRATTSGGPYAAVAGNITSTSYSDSGLSAGTAYYYVVSAVNSAGESADSAEVSASTIPSAPTNPVATAMSASQIDLSWAASSGAGSYYVKRATTTGGPYEIVAAGITTNDYSHTGLSASTTYYYVISAVNVGGESTDSIQASATTSAPAPAPTFVAAGAVAAGTDTIVPPLPSGIASGDILLLFVETANQAVSISNENGGTWGTVTNTPQGTGAVAGTDGVLLTVFWSRYNGTQGDPTVSDSGDHQLARMIAIRGAAASGIPWDVTAGAVDIFTDGGATIPGATSTVVNALVVVASAGATPDSTITANFSGWTNANLTSLTERIDNTTGSGNGGSIGVATGVKETAGAYGNTSVSHATDAKKGMVSIAIKSDDSAGGVTAPSVPTSPAATAMSASQIDVSWTTSSGAESYTVKRATTNGGPYTTVASGVTSTSYSNTGLTASTTYYYIVSAVNSAGESAGSTVASATTQNDVHAYNDWADSINWGTSDPSPGADANSDGLVNLAAYYMDLDPVATAFQQSIPAIDIDTLTVGGPWLNFTYRENPKAGDITTVVQSSATLQGGDWIPVVPDGVNVISEVADPDPDGDGSAVLKRVRMKISEGRCFVRLHLTLHETN